MKKRIGNHLSAAAFPVEDPSRPVSWILQYSSGAIGTLYTMEAHRKKGLGLAVAASLCQAILDSNPDFPPHCQVDLYESVSAHLFRRLGFIQSPSLRHYFSIGVDVCS